MTVCPGPSDAAGRVVSGEMRGRKRLCYTATHSTEESGKGLHRGALIGGGKAVL